MKFLLTSIVNDFWEFGSCSLLPSTNFATLLDPTLGSGWRGGREGGVEVAFHCGRFVLPLKAMYCFLFLFLLCQLIEKKTKWMLRVLNDFLSNAGRMFVLFTFKTTILSEYYRIILAGFSASQIHLLAFILMVSR